MGTQKFLKLDYEIIKSSYPLALNNLVEWFLKREDVAAILASEENKMTPSQLKESMEHVASMVIQFDPRKLYDFFDDKNIIIYIGGHPDTNNLFVYHNSAANQSMSASSRIDAEQQAFIDAFKILEQELKDA